jgi:hypothetical protein
MTVLVADAAAHVQRQVSVAKMATALEACTTEEQLSVCAFCEQKVSMQRIFTKKCFLFTVGCVCRVKRFTTGSRNSLKGVQKSQMMPDQVRKWLRQQSEDSCAVGFDALVKWRDKCIFRYIINVRGGDMSRNKCFFFQVRILCFTFYIHLCLFTDSPSYVHSLSKTMNSQALL